jgi:hypothetical protein
LSEALLEGGDIAGSSAVATAAEPLLPDLAAVRLLARTGDLRLAAATVA